MTDLRSAGNTLATKIALTIALGTTSGAAHALEGDFAASYKAAFVRECLNSAKTMGAASLPYCLCMADELTTNFTQEEAAEFERHPTANVSEMPPKVSSALKKCAAAASPK